MALESYDPKLIEAWRKGATEQVSITLATRQLATKLRQKLYRLRVELGKLKHEAYPSAARAQVRIVGPSTDDKWTVLVEPEGAEIAGALEAAGLGVPDLPEGLEDL